MARKSKKLAEKKIVTIYCEGQSEAAYFKMLSRKYGQINVQSKQIRIEHIQRDRGVKMLEKIAREVHRLPRNKKAEQVYACFDRDNLARAELERCGKYAREHHIRLIFSSINFEIWILMHFEPVGRAYTAQQLNQKLSGTAYFQQDYAHFKGADYDHFLLYRVKTAVMNARTLLLQRGDDWLTNDPYTNVHQWLGPIYGVSQY